jgi:hypothetical protein
VTVNVEWNELSPERKAGIRAEFTRLRAESMNIACTYCKAIIGEVCINLANQGQLTHMPAHMSRIKECGQMETT